MDDSEFFDYIIFSTRIENCLLTQRLSESNSIKSNENNENKIKILQVEDTGIYGSLLHSTIHIKEHDIYVDTLPVLLNSNGPICNEIIRIKAIDHLSFKPITKSIILIDHNRFVTLPSSKEDVMLSTEFSLLEKRQLGRIILNSQYFNSNDTNSSGINLNSNSNINSSINLNSISQSPIIKKLIFYGICHFHGNENLNQFPLESQIQIQSRIKNYIEGLGKFKGLSDTPYLYPIYGLGEISQTLCRIASVQGGAVQIFPKEIIETTKTISLNSSNSNNEISFDSFIMKLDDGSSVSFHSKNIINKPLEIKQEILKNIENENIQNIKNMDINEIIKNENIQNIKSIKDKDQDNFFMTVIYSDSQLILGESGCILITFPPNYDNENGNEFSVFVLQLKEKNGYLNYLWSKGNGDIDKILKMHSNEFVEILWKENNRKLKGDPIIGSHKETNLFNFKNHKETSLFI